MDENPYKSPGSVETAKRSTGILLLLSGMANIATGIVELVFGLLVLWGSILFLSGVGEVAKGMGVPLAIVVGGCLMLFGTLLVVDAIKGVRHGFTRHE